LKAIRSLLRCERGVSTIEMAIVITALLGLLFGIFNIGIMMWTVSSLRYAAEGAARCAAIDTTNCGSASAVQAYAMTLYSGQPLGESNPFTYSATGCGHTVTASYTYSLSIPLYGSYSIPLSASACFP
jgi:Flp pilus assembly protein TadG